MLHDIPLDVLKYNIFPMLELRDQVYLKQVSKYLYNNLDITDLLNIEWKLKVTLTDKIISNYPKLEQLDLKFNTKVTNLVKFEYLKVLHIKYDDHMLRWGFCPDLINDHNMIYLTNLEELHISGIWTITNLNHLKKLKILIAHGSLSGISDKSIKYLENLEELRCLNNNKITDVNHLKKLKILDPADGVCDSGISELYNLEELSLIGNSTITKIGHLIKLKKLNLSAYNGKENYITDYEIKKLVNLEELDCSACYNITDLNSLTKLKKLDISWSSIGNANISDLINLEELEITGNNNVTDLSNFIKLEKLDATHNTNFIWESLFDLKNLKEIKYGWEKMPNDVFEKLKEKIILF